MKTDDSDAAVPEGLREQRESLYATLVELEAALATAGPRRVEEWATVAIEALERVAAAFDAHVRFTEDAGGLFEDVVTSSPGLVHSVEELRTDHRRIRDCLDETLRMLRGGVTGDPATWVGSVRTSAGALLGQLTRHRQKGSDLTYEAFWHDEGGSG